MELHNNHPSGEARADCPACWPYSKKIAEWRDDEAEAQNEATNEIRRRYHEGRRDAYDRVLWLLRTGD